MFISYDYGPTRERCSLLPLAQVLRDYIAYRNVISEPNLNSGLVKKVQDARHVGCSTEFEGQVIKAISLPNGPMKKRSLQDALATLTAEAVPLDRDFILPQILAYAREHGKALKVPAKKADEAGPSTTEGALVPAAAGLSSSGPA